MGRLLKVPTVKELEEAIKIPVEEWRGNCHGISDLLREKFEIEAELRYGSWLGKVAKGSMFAKYPNGLIHHGWLELPDKSIIDPTRFEFEQVEPYIYVGKNDYYDAGSNMYRFKNMKPAPKYSKDKKQVELHIGNLTSHKFVVDTLEGQLGGTYTVHITLDQAFWLANLPLQVLGDSAKDIYSALRVAGYIALVPWDNRKMVLKD